MAESSSENPEKTINFQVTPAIKLKQSIESLNDSEFNPENVGRIDITEKGFEITVINSETNAGGYLFFKSSGLINFHCVKPIVSKLISLYEASLIFNVCTDDDTVTISHVDEANYLTFVFGSAPNIEMQIEFLEEKFVFNMFPDITFFCEATMTSDILRQMIQKLEETGESQLVSVDITERLVSFLVGERAPWTLKYETDKVVGTRGVVPGQKHHAWFKMQHLEALKKATNLAPCLLMCLLTKPVGYVMMRFSLRELGDLVFINKATKLLPNLDDILRNSGTNAAADVARQPV